MKQIKNNSICKGGAILSLLFISLNQISCKKLVEVESPPTSITVTNAFDNDATSAAVLTGVYARLSANSYTSLTGLTSLSRLAGLSSDELTLWSGTTSPTLMAYYINGLYATPTASAGSEFWSFNDTYVCNSVIEGITSSSSLTPSVKSQLLGEAKFMRAFLNFHLVNLFGDLPLVVSTNYQINRLLPRASKNEIYQQIISDLIEAKDLLSSGFLDATLLKSTAERVRPTKWAATALLARTYLYIGDWANAETESSIVINNTNLFDTLSLNKVFLKNSKEAIWQLQPVNANWNTEDARAFNIPSTGFGQNNPYSLSKALLSSFEANDQRRSDGNWVKSIDLGGVKYYYPYKYKVASLGSPVSEYLMVFRLAEQYLIRSEARVQQGNIANSQSDLNIIRKRAGLSNSTANDKNSLLSAILHERQVELFTEWGHRWFDLKRTGNADVVMNAETPIKGGTWEFTDQLYPIRINDILQNQNLTQNSGY